MAKKEEDCGEGRGDSLLWNFLHVPFKVLCEVYLHVSSKSGDCKTTNLNISNIIHISKTAKINSREHQQFMVYFRFDHVITTPGDVL